ncbi:Gfo/Idh/MocA family protein [Actomonas aquatica]|uniref:Gfo/Idh/MocA family oxidoreductase n=1 Tax=Actomonas aquatica TaxID=2866162 RepID=A0ABZ1C2P9_9BACT|nr:Gfo/Idh/MocA family oxidoreductase [Opitutus sp. WL0086]WRQ85518.1 Gfo/Idh/MocA family oxidoreductase [Opitutus sp. WL0086]
MASHSALIIGCGSIGERHLRCFQQTGRATVIACEANPSLLERITADYAVPGISDWQRLAPDERIDCAIICTPAPSHVEIARALLARGIHVLIEKPLSHSLQDVDSLIAARDRSGCQAGVAYVYRVFPLLEAAASFLQAGSLGPIVQAHVTTGQPFHLLRPAYASTYYRDHASGGGAIQDGLTHVANWIESVLGPTRSLICDSAHQVLADVEVEDTVHVAARHDGALVNYVFNQFQLPNEMTFQFNAARGSVKVELHANRWGVCTDPAAGWTWHELPQPERDTHFTAQANAFLDAIEGTAPVRCTLEDAAHTLRFNLAALQASQRDQRVHLADLHA